MIERDLEEAHKHASRHRKVLEKSEFCGCFYCLRKSRPSQVRSWLDDDTTAVCPQCGMAAVIPAASGIDIRKPFLTRMRTYWFGIVEEEEEKK